MTTAASHPKHMPVVNVRAITVQHFNVRFRRFYEMLYYKESSSPFTAPESCFVVLLSYTQFFIFDKVLFGC